MNLKLCLASFFPVLAIVIFINLDRSPFAKIPGYDQQVYQYVGMLISEGYAPYVDVFDHKPPLTYLLRAAMSPFYPWGDWLMERILIAVTATFLFVVLRARGSPWSAASVGIYLLLSNINSVASSSGHIRVLTSLLSLCLFVILPATNRSGIWVGVIIGTVFWLLPSEIILPLAILFSAQPKLLWSRSCIISLAAGFAVVSIAVIAYLLIIGAFDEFVDQVIYFNFAYAARLPGIEVRARELFNHLAARKLLYLAFALMVVAPFLRASNFFAYPRLAVSLLIGASLFSASLSGHFYGHYFQPFLAAATILLAVVALELRNRFYSAQIRDRIIALCLGTIIVLALPWRDMLRPLKSSWYSATRILEGRNRFHHRIDSLRPLLERHRRVAGELYVYDYSTYLIYNTYFKIRAPTRFAYTFLLPKILGRAMEEEILESVSHRKPSVVLTERGYSLNSGDLARKWNEFLQSEYREYKRYDGRYSTYVRRDLSDIR